MLNEQQKKVVDFYKGQCVVTACPGSGKTHCITERVANLIARGVNPSSILCLTFTNKAGKEMQSRICERLGVDSPGFYIGTFHSLCVKILKKFGDKIGYDKTFSIFDDDDQMSLMKHIFRELGYGPEQQKKFNTRSILFNVNMSREMAETELQMADRFEDPIEYKIAQKYLIGLKEQNAIDFSGLLYETIRLLKEHPAVLQKLQNVFEFVQVDEMQDTNYAQFTLVNLFSGKHKNILIVGDINQSIYKFRGARYQNIIDFMKMYPDCVEIPLGQNYRSTPQIIKLSERLIKHNSSFMGGDFSTDNSNGEIPTCKSHATSRDEAESIASHIRTYIDEEGWDLSDIAVFYRLNRLSLELQSALGRNGIPFTVIGGPSFFNRMEIKDCLSMLKWLSNPKDKVAFHRVIDMFWGIGQTTYDSLVSLASENNMTLMKACYEVEKLTNRKSICEAAKAIHSTFSFDFSGMHAGNALATLIERMNYTERLKNLSKSTEEYEDRKGNVEELINNATIFGQKNSEIDAYLQNIALVSSSDKDGGDAVSLMTLHACKGLEFPVVFMIGVEKDILPHSLAVKEGQADGDMVSAIEEERRICYVGMTRAKKRLHLSFAATRVNRQFGRLTTVDTGPSFFLSDAGLI